jgi:hypothetical protein
VSQIQRDVTAQMELALRQQVEGLIGELCRKRRVLPHGRHAGADDANLAKHRTLFVGESHRRSSGVELHGLLCIPEPALGVFQRS